MHLEKLSTYISIKEGLSPPLIAGIVLNLVTFDHMYFCHYDIVAKNRSTVEPRYYEVPRDCQNVFAIMRFRYIEVLFHIFYYYWGQENRSLYRGLRYIEVRYIEVPL